MSTRDDMVIRPTLDEAPGASVSLRAQEERLVDQLQKGKLARRLRAAAQASAKRRLAARAARARRMSTVARAGSAAVRGAGSAAARGIGRLGARAAGTPVGLIAAAVIVAGVVTLRLASGQPLEGTGEAVNRMILGDTDDEARAKMATRAQFGGDSDIARIVGQEGKVNSQVRSIAEDIQRINFRDEKGASLLREAFPSNNALDMLILRARDKLLEFWNGTGGPGKVEEIGRRIGALTATESGASPR